MSAGTGAIQVKAGERVVGWCMFTGEEHKISHSASVESQRERAQALASALAIGALGECSAHGQTVGKYTGQDLPKSFNPVEQD